tara:strand:- start:545 stop:793 length:249 start_codon:yes stop_codon:yes gene_type:complete
MKVNNEIEQAKQVLKNNGYYIDNLWHINDVKDNPNSNEDYFICSDKKAYNILRDAIEQDGIYESINNSITLIVNWETKQHLL